MVDKLERAYCNKCGFMGVPDGMGFHARPSDGQQCNYLCRSFTPANGDQVERADEADRVELAAFLDTYADEADGDLVNRNSCDPLLTWGILRRLLATLPTPAEDVRERVKVLEGALEKISQRGTYRSSFQCQIIARTALGNKETDRHG